MKQVQSHLKNLDFFSVPFSPAINDNEEFYHKSVFGGTISLMVICLSIVYSVYTLVQWQNLELLPKVTSRFSIFTEEEKLMNTTISISLKSVGYFDDYTETVDPFEPTAIVIMPLISFTIDNYFAFENYQQFHSKDQLDMTFTIRNQSQPIVTFILCNKNYLFEGQKCADEETVKKFNSQVGNQLYMSVRFNIVNSNTFEINEIKRTYSLIIQENQCTTETIFLQLTKYDIDEGFIIPSKRLEYYYTDSTDQSQYSNVNYCSQMFMPETIAVLWLISQDQLRIESMVYPKISEVLANIGSIVSILFMVKYLIIQVNLFNMRGTALNFLIQQYYPEINQFQIIKNWRRKIQSIKFNTKEIDPRSFEAFRENIRKLIASKLNYINLVYEVSRIQIILQSMQNRKTMRQSHLVGTKLRLKQCDYSNKFLIQNDIGFLNSQNFEDDIDTRRVEQVDILQIKDAVLLGIQTKQSLLHNVSEEEDQESTSIIEFYKQNRVI